MILARGFRVPVLSAGLFSVLFLAPVSAQDRIEPLTLREDDAARRVRALGGAISNVDVTILCEAPRIAPHREAMRARVAENLEIGVSRVAVKATTTEGLGFTGRREGIAALATATVVLR